MGERTRKSLGPATAREHIDPRAAPTPALPAPMLGRGVHVVSTEEVDRRFRLPPGVHLAALITLVGADTLHLTIFPPGYEPIPTSVGIANYGTAPGQWHWPELA